MKPFLKFYTFTPQPDDMTQATKKLHSAFVCVFELCKLTPLKREAEEAFLDLFRVQKQNDTKQNLLLSKEKFHQELLYLRNHRYPIIQSIFYSVTKLVFKVWVYQFVWLNRKASCRMNVRSITNIVRLSLPLLSFAAPIFGENHCNQNCTSVLEREKDMSCNCHCKYRYCANFIC